MGLILFAMIVSTTLAQSSENMLGRQSQNEGMLVVPAPGELAIDGKLDEWDLSGRIWVFADKDLRSQYSVEAAGMWTKDALYLAAKWRDPTPMYSTVNPAFNPQDGWKSDSWQMRVVTDRPLWITTWYFTPKEMPVMHVSYWTDPNNSRAGQDITLLAAEPGGTELGEGVEMAYRELDDGGGYVQEIKIPWELLYAEKPDVKPGMVLRLGNEFLWGDPSGKTWPVHRYADNMQPGHTSREFYWTAKRAWGDARLVAEGEVDVRRYIAEGEKLEGTIPLRAEIPGDAARFTLVIDDARGNRIRNLGGLDPADYTVAEQDGQRTVEVLWDGLTDKEWSGNHREGFSGEGQLVPPGTYHVHGLYHHGIDAQYEMCFYNPGTPPWRTGDTSGAWGSNHAAPENVAAAGDWMIVAWPFSEGGSATIGIAPDGLKQWGELRGGATLAADAEYVYATPWQHGEITALNRFDAKTGEYRPFLKDGKAKPFDLELSDMFGNADVGVPVAMSCAGDRLAIAMSTGVVGLFDTATADRIKTLDVDDPKDIALAGAGDALMLYAISGRKVVAVDVTGGGQSAVRTPGLGAPTAVTVDHDGNLLVADMGPDSQVKAYRDGRVAYTCGVKGGRPIRGKFDKQAMTHVADVAVDAAGQVWVTESWNYPRRVSVWGRDGKLVRDYIGNAAYAGSGCYLHDQDPTLGYAGPIEMKLDRETRTWEVTQVLWVPDPDVPGEGFPISTQTHVQPQRFRSDASGETREYLYAHDARDGGGQVVYMRRPNGWMPVAAVCSVRHFSGEVSRRMVIDEMPTGEFSDLSPFDGVFWNDANRDGAVQRDECEIVPTGEPGEIGERGRDALPLGNGWGGRIDTESLTIHAEGLTKYEPAGFDADGAPIYHKSGMKSVGVTDHGDLVPVPREDRLLCLSRMGYAGPTRIIGVDLKRGEIDWRYPNPYPGVHGSHRAPMPEPGLIIGPLKILGTVNLGEEIGTVFAMRGNLGQDYFMTSDGVFVEALFRDGRLPGEKLPAKEDLLIGQPMGAYSEGGEPFSGWLGRQNDGVVRMTTSIARTASMIVRLNGLDTIERFTLEPLKLDEALLAKVVKDNQARAAAAATDAKVAMIHRMTDVKVDADDADWADVPAIPMARRGMAERGEARLAYDDATLYVLFEVTGDKSPWVNGGKDFGRLFKTGDAVDIQLSPNGNTRRQPGAGDLRVVIAKYERKPVAVLMKPVAPDAPADAARTYTSPVGSRQFDMVKIIDAAKIKAESVGDGYVVEAAIPLGAIGLEPKAGETITGDVGFISSDSAGQINSARTYWSNKNTNLVNDEPLEAWLTPHEWGKLTWQ